MENIENIQNLTAKDIEELVLGTILTFRGVLQENASMLNEELFCAPVCKILFKEIQEIYNKGLDVNEMTLVIELNKKNLLKEVGGAYYISKLTSKIITSTEISTYIIILTEKRILRKLLELSEEVKMRVLGGDDALEILDNLTTSIDKIYITSPNKVYSLSDATKEVITQINRNYQSEGKLTGIPTGFNEFDKRGGGLQGGDLVVIAADSSQGKTSLALSITNNSTRQGYRCAYYSLEMSKMQLAARLVAMETNISSSKLLFTKLSQDDIRLVNSKIDEINKAGIYFDDRSTANIDSIISSIKTMKLKYKIDFVVVDFLQIIEMNKKGASKEEQLAECARRLKNVAKELNITVILLCQLAKDYHNPEPSLMRLRGSGQINEAADVTMLIYRPEVYNKPMPEPFENQDTANTAIIDIAKGRNIGIFKFLLGFDAQTTKFYNKEFSLNNLTKDAQEQPSYKINRGDYGFYEKDENPFD